MTLEERLDSFAEAWRPEPGDKLVGVVVDLDERASSYDEDPYPIVTVRRDSDGAELAWHAFHTVGRNELAKQRPVVGDRIGVAYHGKPDGKTYESYRVIVERADAAPKTLDWARHETGEPEHEQDTAEAELDDGDDAGEGPSDDDIPF